MTRPFGIPPTGAVNAVSRMVDDGNQGAAGWAAAHGVRQGPRIPTFSQGVIWPFDPVPDDIKVEDIAHALSMQPRLLGHGRFFYSTAERSVHLANAVKREHALWALLLHAPDAYLLYGRNPRKPFPGGFAVAEAKLLYAVALRFGLSPTVPAEAEAASLALEVDEWALLPGSPIPPDDLPAEGLGAALKCWVPLQAEEAFLAAFDALVGPA